MKTTKRILSIALALALALSLALPGFAAEPVIKNITPERLVGRAGEDFTITVAAQGAETYQWYQYLGRWVEIEGATSNALTVTAVPEEFRDGDDVIKGLQKGYQVVITNDEGQTSRMIIVKFFLNPRDSFQSIFRIWDYSMGTVSPIIWDAFKLLFMPALLLGGIGFVFFSIVGYYGILDFLYQ
ncbi:MAG: hypothetical protein FWE98_01895 [Oscillospiraceae bacterium]|nr:hypothetical protein [Oscillospiraceae bacterium]